MIKRIPVEFVSVGMYVSDLNAAWIPHSNVRKQGLIKSEAVIEKIKKMGAKAKKALPESIIKRASEDDI